MRKPEQRLWDRLRQSAPPKFLLERIENVVGTGRPDVDLLVEGRVWNVELKVVEAWPARRTTPVLGRNGLSLAQRNWHLKRLKHGGNVCTLIKVGTVYLLYKMRPEIVDKLNGMDSDTLVIESDLATPMLADVWKEF